MPKAVHACILLIFIYEVPAWWPGRLQKDKEIRDIKNGMEGYCKMLDKSQTVVPYAIFPV